MTTAKKKKSAAKKPLTLHIVLDTNFLFTEAEDKLLASEISELILESHNSKDVELVWYLPSVVEAERKYQMLKRAKTLLPKLQTVERLIGTGFGITGEVLDDRVIAAIKKQIDKHRLVQLDLDISKANWEWIISRALLRLPPFEEGNEKGFRDALILESFIQLSQTLPQSLSVCRVIMVSNDEKFGEAFETRVERRDNIKFFENLELLKDHINVLRSDITEAVATSLKPIAQKCFFSSDTNEGIYYKLEVWDLIQKKIKPILDKVLDGRIVTSRKSFIADTSFSNKNNQQVTWATKINYTVQATKNRVVRTSDPALTDSPWRDPLTNNPAIGFNSPELYYIQPNYLTIGTNTNQYMVNSPYQSNTKLVQAPSTREVIVEDKYVRTFSVEVVWSATLTTRNQLTKPKIIEIKIYEEGEWKAI